MSEITLFHFEDGRQSFEDLGRPNGVTHWTEESLRQSLGYAAPGGLQHAITRAKQACLASGLHCEEHLKIQPDGTHLLTRFGCFLVAMNADPKKPQVAAAQVYFAALADTCQNHQEHIDGVDRLLVRDDIADGQKSLASTAKQHGVQYYGLFQDAGYRGMYNMPLSKLLLVKGAKRNELIDRMGKTEMAAHLFRITQTDAKIKNQNIRGQTNLENAARDVGRDVRNMMIQNSGTAPENLPLSEHVKEVKKKLKGTSKALGDRKKKRPKGEK